MSTLQVLLISKKHISKSMFHFEAQDKISLIKRLFVVTHTIRQTDIPAPE
jgi:hypothetical protein